METLNVCPVLKLFHFLNTLFFCPLSLKENILFTWCKPEIWVDMQSNSKPRSAFSLLLRPLYFYKTALTPALTIPHPFLASSSSFSTHLHDSHVASPSQHTSYCRQSDLPASISAAPSWKCLSPTTWWWASVALCLLPLAGNNNKNQTGWTPGLIRYAFLGNWG